MDWSPRWLFGRWWRDQGSERGIGLRPRTNEGHQARCEARGVKFLSVAADNVGIEPLVAEIRDRIRQRLGCLLLEKDACLARQDASERATRPVRDHRLASGLRLDRRDAEILFAREDERAASRKLFAGILVTQTPEEGDVPARHRAQLLLVAP